MIPQDKLLTAKEKIDKANMKIQQNFPFFAYVSFHLNFEEDTKGELPDYGCAGVDLEGNIKYKKDFIDNLSLEETKGVIIHEMCHLIFHQILRGKNKEKLKWNISIDVEANQILKENEIRIPKDSIVSNEKNVIEIFGNYIEKCDKKTAEEIYEEIKLPESMSFSDSNGFDYHDYSEKSDEEIEKISEKWENIVTDAYNSSKMQGNVPEGVERLIGKLHKEKIDWKTLLERYVVNQIPYDFSFNYPSKKSIAVGQYLPNIIKERIDIIVCIDLSGSINNQELNDFISEVVGIAKSYQDRISMRILTHEVKINEDYLIEEGNINKIKEIKINGGGGTSFNPSIEYIKKNYKDVRLVVWFTDGCAEEVNRQPFEILWVLCKDGIDNMIKSSGEVIKIE